LKPVDVFWQGAGEAVAGEVVRMDYLVSGSTAGSVDVEIARPVAAEEPDPDVLASYCADEVIRRIAALYRIPEG
jgi:hypothetical protein